MLFSHMTVGSNDIDKSEIFYDALFDVMGVKGTKNSQKNLLMYAKDNQFLLVMTPIDGKPATFANGGTIGFSLDSAEAVKAWHQAGVEHGGKSVEDPPGVRENGGVKMYLAYLRDPDGNKLCGYYLVG